MTCVGVSGAPIFILSKVGWWVTASRAVMVLYFLFIFLMKTRSYKEGSEKFIVKMGGKKGKSAEKMFCRMRKDKGSLEK